MNKIDLAFVGNGIITYVSALQLKAKQPDLQISIIGPTDKPFSASLAAGAMQAVFCEVEETFHKLARDREIFDIGLEARPLWHAFLDKFALKDTVTAESTIMYRRKQGTLFEEVNFEAACGIAAEHKCIEDVSSSDCEKIFCGILKPADVIAKKFIGEFAIDTKLLFVRMHELLEKMGVTFINDRAQEIIPAASGIDILLQSDKTINASRVVVAAGTECANILRSNFAMVPLYHGVGTSMVLDSAPDAYPNLKMVVRTTNRGGAQCGMHIVPRNDGQFYLGAGNYFSDMMPAHRAETIRYLIDTCDEELFGKQVIYKAKTELLLGSRPKSVDGYAVIGSYKSCPNLFVATGTYRIGLTIAPVIAAEICNWQEGKAASGTFKNCSPERALHSYAPLEVATRYFSESRISNLCEHGLLDLNDKKAIADKKVELEAIAQKMNAEIVQKHGFASDFIVDPDMYSILIEAEANQQTQTGAKRRVA